MNKLFAYWLLLTSLLWGWPSLAAASDPAALLPQLEPIFCVMDGGEGPDGDEGPVALLPVAPLLSIPPTTAPASWAGPSREVLSLGLFPQSIRAPPGLP